MVTEGVLTSLGKREEALFEFFKHTVIQHTLNVEYSVLNKLNSDKCF